VDGEILAIGHGTGIGIGLGDEDSAGELPKKPLSTSKSMNCATRVATVWVGSYVIEAPTCCLMDVIISNVVDDKKLAWQNSRSFPVLRAACQAW